MFRRSFIASVVGAIASLFVKPSKAEQPNPVDVHQEFVDVHQEFVFKPVLVGFQVVDFFVDEDVVELVVPEGFEGIFWNTVADFMPHDLGQERFDCRIRESESTYSQLLDYKFFFNWVKPAIEGSCFHLVDTSDSTKFLPHKCKCGRDAAIGVQDFYESADINGFRTRSPVNRRYGCLKHPVYSKIGHLPGINQPFQV